MRISLIGGGSLGSSIAKAYTDLYGASSLTVAERDERAQGALRSLGISVVSTVAELPSTSDILVYAVKPQDRHAVSVALSPSQKCATHLSVMAGVGTSELSLLAGHSRIMRVMPNLLIAVKASITAFLSLPDVEPTIQHETRKLFQSVGSLIEVLDEEEFHEFTAAFGSGPGFVAHLMQSYVEGIQIPSLTRKQKQVSVNALFAGTAQYLTEKNISAAELISMVASKGGTTEAGLSILNLQQVSSFLGETLAAATDRSKELGKK